jgi:hypothetical protein
MSGHRPPRCDAMARAEATPWFQPSLAAYEHRVAYELHPQALAGQIGQPRLSRHDRRAQPRVAPLQEDAPLQGQALVVVARRPAMDFRADEERLERLGAGLRSTSVASRSRPRTWRTSPARTAAASCCGSMLIGPSRHPGHEDVLAAADEPQCLAHEDLAAGAGDAKRGLAAAAAAAQRHVDSRAGHLHRSRHCHLHGGREFPTTRARDRAAPLPSGVVILLAVRAA